MEEVDKEIDEDESNTDNKTMEKEAVENVIGSDEPTEKLNDTIENTNNHDSNNSVGTEGIICNNIDLNHSINQTKDDTSEPSGVYSFEEPVALQFG